MVFRPRLFSLLLAAFALTGAGGSLAAAAEPAACGQAPGCALVNGAPAGPLSGTPGSRAYYYVDVPAGASVLTIKTSGGPGDADLYVRFGEIPTLGAYLCRPSLTRSEERCRISHPAPGRWHIMLHGYTSYQGVTLLAQHPAVACTYAVSPLTVAAPAGGMSGSVAVATGASCGWTAASSASWLTIASGNAGSGNGAVAFAVAVNGSTVARTATLMIADRTVTVTQAGVACAYAVTPTSVAIPPGGGTGVVAVTTGAGCSW